MAWAMAATTAVLAALLVVVAVALLRIRSRLTLMESRLAANEADSAPKAHQDRSLAPLDDGPADYLITRVGEVCEPVPVRVDGATFADQLARESAVQLGSLAHGLRRALSAETRHRIRFHMRQEVKRARKQRRLEMRVAHREWTARQRTAAADELPADRSADHSADRGADHSAGHAA